MINNWKEFFIEEKKITNAVGHPVKIVKRTEIHGESNGITQKENSRGGIERNSQLL